MRGDEPEATTVDDPIFDRILPLFDEAQRITESLPQLRRDALERLKAEFPALKYKTWSGLQSGERHGKVGASVVAKYQAEQEKFAALERQAWNAKREAERLRDLRLSLDRRVWLDPKADVIPAGEHPKIRDCTQYPLRKSCNFGENAEARWPRCEFMQYDNSQSIFSPSRWICTAPRA